MPCPSDLAKPPNPANQRLRPRSRTGNESASSARSGAWKWGSEHSGHTHETDPSDEHIAPADYREGSHLLLLLAEMVREIADRILRIRIEERENATVAAPGF